MKKCMYCGAGYDQKSEKHRVCRRCENEKCSWCDKRMGRKGPMYQNIVKDFCSEDCVENYLQNEGL